MQTPRWLLWMFVTSLVTCGVGCQSALYFDRSLIPNDAGADAGDAGDDADADAGATLEDSGGGGDAGGGGDGSNDASDQ